MFDEMKNSPYLENISRILRKTKGSGMKTFIMTDNEYLAAAMDGLRDDVKEYERQVKNSRKIIIDETKIFLENLDLFNIEERKVILNKFNLEVK